MKEAFKVTASEFKHYGLIYLGAAAVLTALAACCKEKGEVTKIEG